MTAHPDKALSAISVRGIKRPGRHADGNGLYLVVDPSGAKRWLLRVVVNAKRTDIGLGGIKVVTLAAAREEAVRLRKIARDGGDPLAERRAAKRVTPTFERAAVEVHASLKCDGPHDVADAGRDHCHPSPSVSNRVDDLTRPHLPRIR